MILVTVSFCGGQEQLYTETPKGGMRIEGALGEGRRRLKGAWPAVRNGLETGHTQRVNKNYRKSSLIGVKVSTRRTFAVSSWTLWGTLPGTVYKSPARR